MDLIPVTDLKQWAYCPRVVYYHRVMPAPPRPTYKMKEGLAAQELIESLEMRRKLREYGLDKAERRRFGIWLENRELGLSGKIDLLLEAAEEIAVVDFKLTSGEPGQNHRPNWRDIRCLLRLRLGCRPGARFCSGYQTTEFLRSR